MSKVNICCVLSDRLNNFDKWLQAIENSVNYYNKLMIHKKDFPFPIKPALTIMYTGKKDSPTIKSKCFSDIKIIYSSFEIDESFSEEERRDAVSVFLSKAYNNLLVDSIADVFWFVEDDILVPENAFHDLYTNLFNEELPKFATCGVYRARHGDKHLLAYLWDGKFERINYPCLPKEIKLPTENQWIACTGTGCLMIFRHMTDHYFDSHLLDIPAHDWNFFWKLSQKNRGWPSVYLVSNVKCKHLIDEKTYVDVEGNIKKL